MSDVGMDDVTKAFEAFRLHASEADASGERASETDQRRLCAVCGSATALVDYDYVCTECGAFAGRFIDVAPEWGAESGFERCGLPSDALHPSVNGGETMVCQKRGAAHKLMSRQHWGTSDASARRLARTFAEIAALCNHRGHSRAVTDQAKEIYRSLRQSATAARLRTAGIVERVVDAAVKRSATAHEPSLTRAFAAKKESGKTTWLCEKVDRHEALLSRDRQLTPRYRDIAAAVVRQLTEGCASSAAALEPALAQCDMLESCNAMEGFKPKSVACACVARSCRRAGSCVPDSAWTAVGISPSTVRRAVRHLDDLLGEGDGGCH